MIDSETREACDAVLEGCCCGDGYGQAFLASGAFDAVVATFADRGYTVAKLERVGYGKHEPRRCQSWQLEASPEPPGAIGDLADGWVPVWRIVEEDQ